MSAIATTRLNDGIVMLSDGRAAKAGGSGHYNKFRKAYRINDSTGFFWIGSYPSTGALTDMQRHLQGFKGNPIAPDARFGGLEYQGASFGAMTEEVSRQLINLYSHDIHNFNENTGNRFIFILASANGQYQVWDSDFEKPFVPKRMNANVGVTLYFGYGGQLEADKKRYERYAQQLISNGIPALQACQKSFKTLIGELSGEGRKVGGDIFCEVLQAPKTSKFQQALKQN